jgi:hypothetical protein
MKFHWWRFLSALSMCLVALPVLNGQAAKKPGMAARACAVVTAEEIAAVIGPAKATPATAIEGPASGTCVYQESPSNPNSLQIVLFQDGADAVAQERLDLLRKNATAAETVTDLGVKAYVSKEATGWTVGIAKGKQVVQFRTTHLAPAKPAADEQAKLKLLAKSASGRL